MTAVFAGQRWSVGDEIYVIAADRSPYARWPILMLSERRPQTYRFEAIEFFSKPNVKLLPKEP